jgi:hypothetical protein
MAMSAITTTTYTTISLVPNALKASMSCLPGLWCGRLRRRHGWIDSHPTVPVRICARNSTGDSARRAVTLGCATDERILEHPADVGLVRDERIVTTGLHDPTSGRIQSVLGHSERGE